MTPKSRFRLTRVLELVSLGLILALAAYLRIHNLANTPGYYSDEGTLLNIAHHLRAGRWQYMALGESTLLVARMPLFPLLLATASSVFGEGILTLRLLTATSAVFSVLVLFVFARRIGGRNLAYGSALVLALHPLAVIYSRIGFSYNLLAILALLLGVASLQFLESGRARSMIVCGLLIGIGITSDLLMLVYLVPIGLIASTRGRTQLAALALGAGIPVTVYGGYMLARAPSAFVFDLQFTLSRLSSIPFIAQFPVAALNFARLLQHDPWFIPAVIGVFTVKPIRHRWFCVLLFLAPLLLISRSVTGLPERGYHYLIPIVPFSALGISSLILAGLPRLSGTLTGGVERLLETWGWAPSHAAGRWVTKRGITLVVALGLFILLLSPFLISGMTTVIGINGSLGTPIDFLQVEPEAAVAAASYVNARIEPNELVIASPAVAWLVDARIADFQLSLAAAGKETLHFPQDIPPERLEYDVTVDAARYVIVDGIWRNWAAEVMPEVAELIEAVTRWPLVFEDNGIYVYEQHPAPGLWP